jgi:transcriptional regulator with XRE-family HTH domain
MTEEEVQTPLDGYGRALVLAWVESGASASELARRVGVTPQAISLLRLGQMRLGLRTARGLAKVIGVDLGRLERRAQDWHRAGRPALGPEALPPREKRR